MSIAALDLLAGGSVPRHRGVRSPSPRQVVTARTTLRGVARVARRTTGWTVLLLAVVMFGFLAVGPHVLGYRTATMLTGSMEPAITPGDMVVSVPRPASEVAVGDVISYHIPVEDHRVETHRVVDVLPSSGDAPVVRTQGDANPGVDPWTARLDGDVVWQEAFVVPRLGSVVRAMRTPFVQTYLFWGGLGGLLLVGLGMIWRDDRSKGADRHREVPTASDGPTIVPTARPEGGTDPDQAGGGMPGEEPVAAEDPDCLDAAALGKLASDMEDEAFARAFARRYQELLQRRVTRIADALDDADLEKAMDALLSLKVSSVTAGTHELATLAAEIESDVRRMDLGAARRRADGLRAAADRAERALDGYLSR